MAAIIGFVWLFSAGKTEARIYRYVDLSGVTHYTDNALEVPSDQRPPLEEAAPQDQEKKAAATESVLAGDRAGQEVVSKKETLEKQKSKMDTRFEQLNRTKQKLDKELQAINRDREQLEKERVVKHSKTAYRIYNQKVKALDERIRAYNARQLEFERQAAVYNAKMRQFEEQRNRLNKQIEAFNQAKTATVSP